MKFNSTPIKTPGALSSLCASLLHANNSNPNFFEHEPNNIRNNSLNGAEVCAKECSPCKGIVF